MAVSSISSGDESRAVLFSGSEAGTKYSWVAGPMILSHFLICTRLDLTLRPVPQQGGQVQSRRELFGSLFRRTLDPIPHEPGGSFTAQPKAPASSAGR